MDYVFSVCKCYNIKLYFVNSAGIYLFYYNKLDTWKNKLLDMGKRNRLLNYRDTRRSNLRIIVPGIYDLWDSFVVNEQPLKFPRVDENENQQLSLEENQLPATDPNSVQTSQSPKEQQHTLRNLRSKAKTFMET